MGKWEFPVAEMKIIIFCSEKECPPRIGDETNIKKQNLVTVEIDIHDIHLIRT